MKKVIYNKDKQLRNLQKYLTSKIETTKNEDFIKFYLQQIQQISQQRFLLRKEGSV